MALRSTGSLSFKRTDMWREGDWLDLWSVVHFLSGISIGLGLFYLHFGSLPAVVTTGIALVAYEMWEALEQIEETPANRTLDVVVGLSSFLPTYFLVAPRIAVGHFVALFAVVFLLNVGLSALGWSASRKAAVLEQSLRARYEQQRARIRRQRARLLYRRRARWSHVHKGR